MVAGRATRPAEAAAPTAHTVRPPSETELACAGKGPGWPAGLGNVVLNVLTPVLDVKLGC